MAKLICYGASKNGYTVQVLKDGEVVFEHLGGNAPGDSTTRNWNGPGAVPLKQLRKWARKTALDLAEEWGVKAKDVQEDPDLESE